MRVARFVIYPREDGMFGWKLKASNGRVIATDHGQGFRDPADAERSIDRILELAADGAYVVEQA